MKNIKKYRVFLSRTYIVDIQAKNEKEARVNVEYYLGDCQDLSTESDRRKRKFLIEKIEPAINDAFEVTEIETDEES